MKVFLITVFVLLNSSAICFASENSEKNQPANVIPVPQSVTTMNVQKTNSVLINPINFLSGGFGFEYQYALTGNFVASVAPSWYYLKVKDGLNDEVKVSGGFLALGGSLYLNKPFEGWNIKLLAGVGYLSISGYPSANMYMTDILGGYRWTWQSGFTMGLGIGARYLELNSDDVSVSGAGLAAELAIGIVF
ncbi:MAG: autotransporter domain-containing protein [Deltaproteobacteria bacterium]|nr:autotransporter domain-containing protein [Deltaproteobacteria bacterium]